MKFTTSRPVLAKTLASLSKVAGGYSGNIPAITGVLVDVEGDQMSLRSTNLRNMLCLSSIPVEDAEDGSLALPIKETLAIVSGTLDSGITIASDGKTKARITSGSYSATMQTFDPDDFPKSPPNSSVVLTLPVPSLLAAASLTYAAAPPSDPRPVLAGLSLTVKSGMVSMACTDSYRMAIRQFEYAVDGEYAVIIPAASMQDLAVVLTGYETWDCDISISQVAVGFRVVPTDGKPGVDFQSRLIDGAFPDFASRLPTEFATTVSASASSLVKAAKLAMVFSELSDRYSPIWLTLTPDGIQVVSRSASGESSDVVPSDHTGEHITVKLRGEYLVDALQDLGGVVSIGLNGPKKIVVVSGASGHRSCIGPLTR